MLRAVSQFITGLPFWPTAIGRQALGAYLASTAAHAALVVGLSWIVLNVEQPQPVTGLLAELEEYQDITPTAALVRTAAQESSSSEGRDTAAPGSGPLAGAFDEPEAPSLDNLLVDVSYRGSRGGQMGLGLGAGLDQELASTEVSPAGDATFFGVPATGKSFVFIVDMSLSMAADARFSRAKAELKRSIEALNSEKKFYVIFYNDTAWPMPAEWLVPATASHVRDVTKWFKRVNPNGGTNPLTSVQMAVEMRSDAIFLLTDGEFSEETAQYLDWGRTSDRTPIHTIAFGSRVGEPLLKAIARMTGGTYKHVR